MTERQRKSAPSLKHERAMMAEGHRLVAAVDEVGRGALAGPVSVGVVVIDATVSRSLRGVRDSKLLSAPEREGLVDRIVRWSLDSAVGHASAAEIDSVGLTAALGLAGRRALRQLSVAADVVLLDGNSDWLSGRGTQYGLFGPEAPDQGTLGLGDEDPEARIPPVRTLIKADMTCSSVAAASVLAKVRRDAMMTEYAKDFPEFGWDINKGYGTPSHREKISVLGPTALHRRTWRLLPDDHQMKA